MNIDKKLIPVLHEVNFANRYKLMCDKHSNFDNRLISYDKSIIKDVFENKGIKTDYIKSENFFKIVEDVGNYKIHFHIIPHSGFIQFLFSLRYEEEKISFSLGVWESITRELLGIKVKKPLFGTIEELKEILDEAFNIYEDFKTELRNQP